MHAAYDALCWVVAIALALPLAVGAGSAPLSVGGTVVVVVALVLVQLVSGFLLGLYRRRFLFGSFHELRALVVSALVTGLIVGVPVAVFGGAFGVPPTIALIALPIALVLMEGGRFVRRARADGQSRRANAAQNTLIYGAGYLGTNLARRMLTDGSSSYRPVGFIDDAPEKQNLRIEGIPVLGSRSDLAAIARSTDANAIVVSIAYADAAFLRSINDEGERLGLRVLVFPVLEEVLEGKSRLRDVRDIGIEDLIGRHPVDTHVESMAGYLRGKRILVTGAGGSIGSELCRQIAKFEPGQLIMLDRDETGLQTTQLLLEGNGLLTNSNIVLADIRDPEALRSIFDERRPQVVFHAAALKHLPMLERYPAEAWKTNVLGTLNVLRAAMAADADTFVNISTDKAANPTSVLGYSKQLAERLTAWAAQATGRRYLSVRFGNVIGSRGSLVPVFAAMIEAGGPLTVTDRDATRFFMTIPEASHLVVQAGGIGDPGEVLILDMGDPVRILDVAERMIALSGRDIAIVFTGLRDGEKLHEELVGEGETGVRRVHPKISHASVTALSPDDLDERSWFQQFQTAAPAATKGDV
ncbi:MAG: polysaccharide biosynthesis protein [Actinobacteria bacterium]|nr:polysaccharide biosynthesis protein [Actinomycetota bacterium]